MCDYSLHGQVNTRLAEEGEELFVNLFHTGCKGLAAVADWQPVKLNWFQRLTNRLAGEEVFDDPAYYLTAVCIPPGARLQLSGIPLGTREKLEVGETEDVVFYQQDPRWNGHHDGFEFSNGRQQLIQLFHEGLRVKVLSLGFEQKSAEVVEEREVKANV